MRGSFISQETRTKTSKGEIRVDRMAGRRVFVRYGRLGYSYGFLVHALISPIKSGGRSMRTPLFVGETVASGAAT